MRIRGIGITQAATRCCISAPKQLLREEPQACTKHSERDPLWHPPSLGARHDVVVRGACLVPCEDLGSTMDPISARPAGCVAGRRLKMGSNCRDTTGSLASGAPARPPGSPTRYSSHWSYPDTPDSIIARYHTNMGSAAYLFRPIAGYLTVLSSLIPPRFVLRDALKVRLFVETSG